MILAVAPSPGYECPGCGQQLQQVTARRAGMRWLVELSHSQGSVCPFYNPPNNFLINIPLIDALEILPHSPSETLPR